MYTMTGQVTLSITCGVFTLCTLPMAVYGISCKDVFALKANLTKEYDKNTNPSQQYMTNINVSVYFKIDAIGNIDERLEKMTTTINLNIHWKDEVMTWNERDTGIRYLTFDHSEVWVPKFFVFNPHYDTSHTPTDIIYPPVLILYDGRAAFGQRLVAETSCSLDMTNFPFDRHTCSIEFVINKYDVTVIPQFDTSNNYEFSPDGTWDVTDTSVSGQFNKIVLRITVARKPTFFLINLISPMTILTLLSPLAFLLPISSGERIGFSVTILLALAVFMTVVSDQVPPKSQNMPRLIYMIFISYSLSALAVIVVVINARIHDFPDDKPVPRVLVALLSCMGCFCFCFRRRIVPTSEETLEEGTVADKYSKEKEIEVGNRKAKNFGAVKWQEVSWTIDMVAMTMIYLLKITLLVVTFKILDSEDDGA